MAKKKPSVKDPRVNKFRSICEVHREIYEALVDGKNQEDIVKLLEEVYVMGKKMDAKLQQYKNNWDNDWWEKNRNFDAATLRRKGKKKK